MGTHVPTNGLMPRARVLSPILRDGRKKKNKHGRICMLELWLMTFHFLKVLFVFSLLLGVGFKTVRYGRMVSLK
jgi:hypothetical protein